MQPHYNRNLILSFVTLIAASCSKPNDAIVGTKIYEYSGNYSELFSTWSKGGINTAFVSRKLATDAEFRQMAKENRIKVFVIFPVFYNPETLANDTTLYAITNKGTRAKQDWVEFVCPSRGEYRNKVLKDLSNLINSTNPDGISIDFVRDFLYWEMVKPTTPADSILHGCYCDSCQLDFEQAKHTTIPDTFTSTYSKNRWLSKNESWVLHKSQKITSMVQSLSTLAKQLNPEIKINLHAVPWRKADYSNARYYIAGQDIKELAKLVDYISPMCYSWMLYREPEWVASVVKDFDSLAPGKILPSIEVNSCYREGILSPEEFKLNMINALEKPSKGVVFWEWDHFEKDSTKIKVLIEERCEM